MIGTKSKKSLRIKRIRRIRAKVTGSALRPRLMIHKSNYALYAQLIDDSAAKTIGSAKIGGTTIANANELAGEIVKIAKSHKITGVVFDRRGFRYHGVVAAFAGAVRDGGITI